MSEQLFIKDKVELLAEDMAGDNHTLIGKIGTVLKADYATDTYFVRGYGGDYYCRVGWYKRESLKKVSEQPKAPSIPKPDISPERIEQLSRLALFMMPNGVWATDNRRGAKAAIYDTDENGHPFETVMTFDTPGSSYGADCFRYICAAQPAVMLAMCNEIKRLREENAALKGEQHA